MQTKIKSIHLENFGKHSEAIGGKPLDIQLGKRTIISGCNKTGKSTIKRSVQYIFGCKDENGKEITGIRPHDENGIDIDGLTTIAEMTVSVDGAENTLKKTCFQKKNRQGEYTGEDNTQYFIDGVRKNTRKSYDEFVRAILPDPVCMSAQEFFKQDTAGRRKLIETTFSNHTTDEIIDQNPEFEELRGKLRANSVSDLKSACNEKINGKGRGANHVDGLNDKLTKLIHQIEFELSKKVDIDVAGLEAQKKAIDEKISKLEERQEDVSKEFEEQQKASGGILELKFELNDLQRKANEGVVKKKQDLQRLHDMEITKERELRFKKRTAENEISRLQIEIDNLKVSLQNDRDKWTEVSKKEFDENSLICSMCGQEYPAEKKEQLQADFESKKKNELKNIEERGDRNRHDLAAAEDERSKNRKKIDKIDKELKQIDKKCWELQSEEDNLPDSIDISGRPEVQEIQRQIAEKEAAMNKGNSAEVIRQRLKGELDSLQSQLYEIQKQLDKAEENNQIDKIVEELKVKQQNISQEIANVERELDLLKQFDRKKAELLESDVNSNFEFVKIRMFERQANSKLKDVCRITVDGEDYDRNLNFSNKLLAEIDICKAFQWSYGVELPIILDNSESIDDSRLPDISNQLIILKRTNDTELKIETEN